MKGDGNGRAWGGLGAFLLSGAVSVLGPIYGWYQHYDLSSTRTNTTERQNNLIKSQHDTTLLMEEVGSNCYATIRSYVWEPELISDPGNEYSVNYEAIIEDITLDDEGTQAVEVLKKQADEKQVKAANTPSASSSAVADTPSDCHYESRTELRKTINKVVSNTIKLSGDTYHFEQAKKNLKADEAQGDQWGWEDYLPFSLPASVAGFSTFAWGVSINDKFHKRNVR